MSFIFQDKNIVNLIHKLAAEPTLESPAVPLSLINSLFDHLSKSAPSELSLLSGEVGFQSTTISDLAGLETLLGNADYNKVSFNKQPISFVTTDILKYPNLNPDLYKKYKTYSVYPEGLKSYLNLLLASPDYKTKPLYRELLGNIIKEANGQFNLGIVLPETKDQSIFKFKSPIILDRPITDNAGDKELFVNDLLKLPEWFKKHSIAISSKDKEITEEKQKICSFLQYLFSSSDPAVSKFKLNIQKAASQYDCVLEGAAPAPSATPSTVMPQLPGMSKEASILFKIIRAEMSSPNFAPYYEWNSGVIFEQGQRGVIPYLRRVIDFAGSAGLTQIDSDATQLLNDFQSLKNELGTNVIDISSRPPGLLALLMANRKDRRLPILAVHKQKFKQLMDDLHHNVIQPLCDQLQLDKWNFEGRYERKLQIISSAYSDTLAVVNQQSPG